MVFLLGVILNWFTLHWQSTVSCTYLFVFTSVHKPTIFTLNASQSTMLFTTRFRELQWECKVSWRFPRSCTHGGVLTRGDPLLWGILGCDCWQDLCYGTTQPAHCHHHALLSPVSQCRHPLNDPVLVLLKNRGGIVCVVVIMSFLKGTGKTVVWRKMAYKSRTPLIWCSPGQLCWPLTTERM